MKVSRLRFHVEGFTFKVSRLRFTKIFMLEIIALIFLTRQVGRMAHDKGLKSSTWKLYTVLAWFAGEIFGALVGLVIFGPDNIFSFLMGAQAGAVTGY